jgi:hypothetical protein
MSNIKLYTTWRHPGISFVYETSLTFRWLEDLEEEEEEMENCHLLTTTLLTRGPWEKEKE